MQHHAKDCHNMHNKPKPVNQQTVGGEKVYTKGVFGSEGGRTLRKDVFLPSKRLLSAFYETLPSKNPSKILAS